MGDLGVQYFSNDEATHLIKALQTNYEITIDKTGFFCSLQLDWDSTNGWVDIFMSAFVSKSLKK